MEDAAVSVFRIRSQSEQAPRRNFGDESAVRRPSDRQATSRSRCRRACRPQPYSLKLICSGSHDLPSGLGTRPTLPNIHAARQLTQRFGFQDRSSLKCLIKIGLLDDRPGDVSRGAAGSRQHRRGKKPGPSDGIRIHTRSFPAHPARVVGTDAGPNPGVVSPASSFREAQQVAANTQLRPPTEARIGFVP